MEKKEAKNRASNWTQYMKESFQTYVEEFAEIVNSKENNIKAIAAKNDAWKSIGYKMSSLGFNLDVKQMKNQWSRMKMTARAEVDQFKRAEQTTIGEPPSSELTMKILEADPYDLMEEKASCDSDTEILASNSEKELNNEGEFPIKKLKRSDEKTKKDPNELLLQCRVDQLENEKKASEKIIEIRLKIEKKKLEAAEFELETLEKERLWKKEAYQMKKEANEAKKNYWNAKREFEFS